MEYNKSQTQDHWLQRAWGLAGMLDAGTIGHLEALGVGPGWRCLEVGAGAGTIPAWLCERVGERGRVLATDLEPALLERLEYSNLEVRRHDITCDPLPEGEFDLVHTRWMLHWFPDPAAVLARLVKALRPGGWLLVEEPDFVTMLDSPESPELRKVLKAGSDLGAAGTGRDNFYGRRLVRALEPFGLESVGNAGRFQVLRTDQPESGAQWLHLSFVWLEEPLVASGMLTRDEIQWGLKQLGEPGVVMLTPSTMAVWGRKPG
jgi:SAM-dependent methyltransferase